MLDGVVKSIAIGFDVKAVAEAAKASQEAEIAQVGADIELLIADPWTRLIHPAVKNHSLLFF